MLKKADKQLIVATLQEAIPKLQALYLFGSQSDGSATQKSDVDIAYLNQVPLGALERWEITKKLASLLSLDVDLVDIASANTVFKYQILSTGERIYGAGYEVEQFETLAYSFYLRFKEERQPIVDEIVKNRSVFGNAHA